VLTGGHSDYKERTVKLGVHIADFTYPSGPAGLADDLTRIAVAAEEEGFARVSVMDHVFQIGPVGPIEHDMLEAYTTLGYLAARTERVQLLAWVTAVTYRDPGLLAKIVTTLDVLSKGRAMLGIGAAWNEEESKGLGLFFPPTKERFERLEEALQICLQMWGEDEGPYRGTHYSLDRTMNVPQNLTKPHPPILIGGGGEKKTLRLVAQYAQACNLFAGPELPHKLDVLKQRCDEVGRDYAEIEKTVMYRFDVTDPKQMVEDLQGLAKLGVQHAHGMVYNVADIEPLRVIGREVLPAVADL
jgi:F420-dependent oxidoreductase-like protein